MSDVDISANIWKNAEIIKNANYKSKQKHDIRINITCDYLRQIFSTLESIVFTALCTPINNAAEESV